MELAQTQPTQPAFAEGRDTFDIDFQHHFHWGTRQNVTWGLEYRLTSDRVNNSQFIRFVPDHRALELASAFGHAMWFSSADPKRIGCGTSSPI